MKTDYQIWSELHNCTHGHCPYGCEHPQPFMHKNKLICGQCAVMCNEILEMIPCDPNDCKEGDKS